jgi:hypothetical protein
MPNVHDWWAALFYDASPEERLRTTRFLWRLALFIFMVWSLGTFTAFGFHGFALANEVDKKIARAVDPIRKQLDEIQSKELAAIKLQLEENKRIQRRILAAQISSQLRDLNRLRCNVTDTDARKRLEFDIDTALEEYRILTGEWYPLTSCKDL